MDNRIRSLVGLEDGKREYRMVEGEVDRETFEFHRVHAEFLFGDKGYAATLGPTWAMIHDPRFNKLEQCSVLVKQGRMGVVRQGIQNQDQAGQFNESAENVAFYAEMLGEGRYFVEVLRSQRYDRAITEILPEREFNVPKRVYETGTFKFKQLAADEQAAVILKASTYEDLFPSAVPGWSEDKKWAFIRNVSPNYFSKQGVSNKMGQALYSLINADLISLVSDYAEVANLQEWVVVDTNFELATPEQISLGENVVFAEVEMLEKALTLRANLRAVAAKILNSLGIGQRINDGSLQLTEFERDGLLRVVYSSTWPDNKPQIIADILQYLFSISSTGRSYEQRVQMQTFTAQVQAQETVNGLKDGSILPVSRATDGVEETPKSAEQALFESIINNPIRRDVFLRLTEADEKITKLLAERKSLLDIDPLNEVLDQQIDIQQQVIDLLSPHFVSADQTLTEDEAGSLLDRVEKIDPTPVLKMETVGEESP